MYPAPPAAAFAFQPGLTPAEEKMGSKTGAIILSV